MDRYFKKPRLATDTIIKADNGEERLNINNNLYRDKDSKDTVDFSRFAPAGEIPKIDKQSPEQSPEQCTSAQVVLMIQPEADKNKEILLRLIDKAISLL